MEVLSIATGAIQIIGFCTQCTMSIVKWVGDVRSVDDRIASFYDEVQKLQATYESLEQTLRSQRIKEAARSAAESPDGAYLWKQLRAALEDSKDTMFKVNIVLNEINSAQGIGRHIKKQLLESIRTGKLARLRQRIVFFNANLSCPIQMLTIMLQLEQRDLSEEYQRQLDWKLSCLEDEMRRLVRALETGERASTMDTTLLASSADEGQSSMKIKDHVRFAREFLTSASVAAASTRSSNSTVPDEQHLFTLPVSRPNNSPLDERQTRVNDWVGEQGPSEAQSSSAPTHQTDDTSDLSDSDSPDDVDFWLRQATNYLAMGHEKLDLGNFESAEKFFRKALGLMQTNDFCDKLSHNQLT